MGQGSVTRCYPLQGIVGKGITRKATGMTVHDHTPGGFFDDDISMMANRMQARHAMLVDGFRHAIADAAVLLLGAEDGRWCYGFAAAGALQVVGVEPSADLVARFGRLPDVGLRERIDLRRAGVIEEMRSEAQADRSYDVIAFFDVLEGQADLLALLREAQALRPKLVIGDGLFAARDEAVLLLERVKRPVQGRVGLRAIPSRGAVALAAREAGFELDWIDWSMIEEEARLGLSDYFQSGPKCRASFVLTPRG